MRFHIKTGLAVVALFAMALPLQAYTGFSVGQPVAGQDIGECDSGNLVFTTPADGAGLFVLREYSTSNDILYSIENNTKTLGCTFSSGGDYDCPGAQFQTPPTENAESVYVIITAYPGGVAGGDHQGWIHIDNTPGLTEDMAPGLEPNVIQRLRIPTATAGVISGGTVGTDPTSGVDFSWEYPTEFGVQVGNLPCDVGGRQGPVEFGNRAIIGFNVYRINVTTSGVDAATSTPMHYLCGPDLDCNTTGDNGFVAFVELGDGTTAVSVDAPTTDPSDDRFGVENRGNTNPNIIFSDDNQDRDGDTVPDTPTDPGLTTDTFTYTYQPVVWGNPTDTYNGIPALDLDGDTIPEFVSPGGVGLGLTANGVSPTEPTILVSTDAVVDGANPTPATGAVDLKATLRRDRGVDLSFLSSIEGDVVGFHLYRSLDGDNFVQFTKQMIAASGTPLSQYTYTDNVDVRRIKGTSSIYYKVEAAMSDGSTQMFGPFELGVENLQAPVRTRRR